jgi:ribokinase
VTVPGRERPQVVVVGSTMIDLSAFTSRVPGPGETVIGDGFTMGFGGKGANQALMARLLGARVAMVNRLGNDVFGRMTLENFDRFDIDTTHVALIEGSSGLAEVWVEPDGTNRIIVVPGANGGLGAEDAIAAISALPPPDVVLGQLEIPQATTAAAFRGARQRGAVTILNPGPAQPLAEELLEVSDWLIPNEVELAMLAGTGGLGDDDLAAYARRSGARLLVTLGEAGVALVHEDGAVERLPADEVRAIDTTGAGDAFVGGFAVGLAAGLDEGSAARLGIACASDSVTRPGTQSSYMATPRSLAMLGWDSPT